MNLQTTPVPHTGSLHVEASKIIAAPSQRVMAIYLDHSQWHRLFPLTIRSARLVSEEGGRQTIEVDHKQEGKVINLLTVVSKEEIKLEEFKKAFNGVFINWFEPIPGGARYRIFAYISLKGFYRFLQPFVRGLIRKRIYRFVLDPMKNYAEDMKNKAVPVI